MGCSSRARAVLPILAVAASGCVSGHLLDAGVRRERVAAYRFASTDGGRVAVRFRARVTNERGDVVGEEERAATLPMAELRRETPRAVETVRVTWGAGEVRGGRLPLWHARAERPAATAVLRVLEGHTAIQLDEEGAGTHAPLSSAAFTRTRTVPWVYALLPLALAADAVVTPVLVLLSPAVLIVGD